MKKSVRKAVIVRSERSPKLFTSISCTVDKIFGTLYVPKGFFTPPFETAASLENRLRQRYAEVTVTAVGSMGCFCCVKGSEDTITHKS